MRYVRGSWIFRHEGFLQNPSSEAVVHLLEALHGLRQEDEVLGLETKTSHENRGENPPVLRKSAENQQKNMWVVLKFAPLRVTFFNFATELQAMWEHARCQPAKECN